MGTEFQGYANIRDDCHESKADERPSESIACQGWLLWIKSEWETVGINRLSGMIAANQKWMRDFRNQSLVRDDCTESKADERLSESIACQGWLTCRWETNSWNLITGIMYKQVVTWREEHLIFNSSYINYFFKSTVDNFLACFSSGCTIAFWELDIMEKWFSSP